MYSQASTANPLGKRPWASRLRGLSYYTRSNFVLPSATPGYAIGPVRSQDVTGGLGLDLSTLTSGTGLWAVGGILLATWFLTKQRKRR